MFQLGKAGEPYQVQLSELFSAWRKDMAYLEVQDAPIHPLLAQLSFIPDQQHWGIVFRHSVFQIPQHDFKIIRRSMGVLVRQSTS